MTEIPWTETPLWTETLLDRDTLDGDPLFFLQGVTQEILTGLHIFLTRNHFKFIQEPVRSECLLNKQKSKQKPSRYLLSSPQELQELIVDRPL